MSNILNSIQEVIAASIKVEVKTPFTRNGQTKYPILVTDASSSFTSGWFVQYNPILFEGVNLRDRSEAFTDLHIARFSELESLILTANYYFFQGVQVEELQGGRKRAVYQPTPAVRLTVTSQRASTFVVVTITDESSPFHMMSIPFTVVLSNAGDGSYHIIGSQEKDRWDRNTDMFREYNANFAPRKGRFYRVHQEKNQQPMMRAKIAVNSNSGQYMINPDGTFAVDTNQVVPEFIQVITNEYKALAYLYEQALMKKAFEIAIAQGLPNVNQATPNSNGQTPSTPTGNFVPAFSIPGMPVAPNTTVINAGEPNPNPPAPVAPQIAPSSAPNLSFPTPGQTPDPSGETPAHGPVNTTINPDDLPWTQDQPK